MKGIWITILIILVIAFAVYFFWIRDDSTANGEDIGYCTLDAKLCPDGSYVGRVPPACNFEACPGETENSTGTIPA